MYHAALQPPWTALGQLSVLSACMRAMTSSVFPAPPDRIQRQDVTVMQQATVDELTHIQRLWPSFEQLVGLRGRKMYAQINERHNTYTVCTPVKEHDSPDRLGLQLGTLAGGWYLRAALSATLPRSMGGSPMGSPSCRQRCRPMTPGHWSSSTAATIRLSCGCRSGRDTGSAIQQGNREKQPIPTTLSTAISRIASGGTIYLRGGTYNYSSTITIPAGNNGTSSARTTLSAYPGESPVLNFSAQSESSSNRGIQLNANYWRLYGITVQRAGDNGIYVGGSNNVIERLVPRQRQRLQRQDHRRRRQLEPVLDRYERLPLLLLQRRPGLVLRIGRAPRRDLRRQGRDVVTTTEAGTGHVVPQMRERRDQPRFNSPAVPGLRSDITTRQVFWRVEGAIGAAQTIAARCFRSGSWRRSGRR
ncbi:hypothetical protein [Streptomyces mirabilis]